MSAVVRGVHFSPTVPFTISNANCLPNLSKYKPKQTDEAIGK